ncbi:MAG: bifunctional riboflavin kinase/FAD synthetase [Epsilonproteobacteria bacterium]|nr:MAG: bifunctional riboflavin kinase/FAD synthetase [Campylobacterota bacterium]
MAYTNNIKSIAIGSFDGIHIAHKALIDQVDALVIIERNGGYLSPGYKRANFTSKLCCFYHFDMIKGLTPEAFVEKLKTDFPQLERIVVGYDFHFGKNKAGNAQVLRELCDKKVVIVDEVSLDGISVHSRVIKTYIQKGKIDIANRLLGRAYSIEGQVISGQGIGKKKLVATINLDVKAYVLPLEGVYATSTRVEGAYYDSVSFLGHRVTTDGSFAVETHIIDKETIKTQGQVSLKFIDFIRKNKKFDSLDALKKQIAIDIVEAKKRLT